MSALTTSRPHVVALDIPVVDVGDDVLCTVDSSGEHSAAVPTAVPAHRRVASPDSCYSPLPSLTHSSPSSSASSLHSVPERTNEHLAILLPEHLWKPDSAATRCDNLYCGTKFSMRKRRHHCRKCGDIFCAACTSHTTPLLDTSNLKFLYPPRNVPLSTFASPASPIISSRVCDDCWDQVHGNPSSPRTPDLIRPSASRMLSSPMSMFKSPLSSSPAASGNSSLSSSIEAISSMSNHPLAASDTAALLATAAPRARKTCSLRTAPSNSSLNSARRMAVRTAHLTLPPELEHRSYGELDAYPLKRSSLLCKASGGGRWEPKQDPVFAGYRPPVPGGKALYELEIERHDRAERARKENPIVKDGEFQYRFPRECEPEPIDIARGSFTMSTF
ncbi:1-phosphatidylinositol-3-phosphate 5-kinase FAB1B [Hypsizygus marmoreus]|uniref:1-phosphatidylinositol-3-phosphate 5-kinase FAB1B n=1 Tax=Hypsizygus marmoreus TaxID=39966 RepID=A0A369K3E9_HYPMA|nr:1-phosphatidylinositol-3-phosphate 5-kinase FAB1B [Hypsizygus marmoreus]